MADRDTPIVVNSEKQLFIDNKFIAESDGITLMMNPPQQMPEPVLVADQPWEGVIGAYNTVLKEGDRFRLWYDVILPEGSSEILRGIAYAESDDGIHWIKLNQSLIEFQGSKENNLVAPRLPDAPRGEMEGATVFRDTNPACPPEERYKLWTKMQRIPPEDIQAGKPAVWCRCTPRRASTGKCMTSVSIPATAIRRTSLSGMSDFKNTLGTSGHGQRRKLTEGVLSGVLNRTIFRIGQRLRSCSRRHRKIFVPRFHPVIRIASDRMWMFIPTAA